MIGGTNTFWDLVEHRSAENPEQTFLLDDFGRSITYSAFHELALNAAAGIHDQGVRENDTVAWQLPTWIESFVLMAAIARIGARQMPLLPIYRESELSQLLPLTEARFWCLPTTWRGTDYRELYEGVTRKNPGPRAIWCDRELPHGDPVVLSAPPGSGAEASWIFPTSGTTSAPKGVLHSDRSILAGASDLATRLGMRPEDRYGIAFPLTHIGGAINLAAALLGGYSLAVTESFDPRDTTEVFRSLDVTVVGGGPAFYAGFLAEQRRDPSAAVLPRLRFMTGGGSPMPPRMHTEVRQEIGGFGIAHGYGMTEACIVAMNAPGDDDEKLSNSVGRPVDNVQLYISDPDGAPLPDGNSGEVCIRGEAVTLGYLGEQAQDSGRPGWFRTGDLGHLDAEGYVHITGRLKDIIIRKGENVSAATVESALSSCPKVEEIAIIGLPDESRGELVCAVVTPVAGAAPTLDDLTAYCQAAGLMRQAFPEQLVLVESLPRNSSGKVIKEQLRERYSTVVSTERAAP